MAVSYTHLDVYKRQAQPNDDALEKVMGATPTRVTWQGQTAEDESLSALAIDLPEGSSVDAENVKVTVCLLYTSRCV